MAVRDVGFGGVPDVLDGVVVGCVRRQEDRGYAFQGLTWLVEAGQGFGVVESGVVQYDRDLLGVGFALESFQGKNDLFGVLVSLDRIQLHLLVDEGQGAEEGLGHFLPVHVWLT